MPGQAGAMTKESLLLLEQLAVLLLSHALAALLDDRPHETTPFLGTADDGHANALAR
jgi:hypothetical protein